MGGGTPPSSGSDVLAPSDDEEEESEQTTIEEHDGGDSKRGSGSGGSGGSGAGLGSAAAGLGAAATASGGGAAAGGGGGVPVPSTEGGTSTDSENGSEGSEDQPGDGSSQRDSEDRPEEAEEEDERDEEEDDEDEFEESEITLVYPTGPWDYLGWGMSPVLTRVKEVYRGEIDVEVVPAGIREIPGSEDAIEEWRCMWDAYGFDMPVDEMVWEDLDVVSNEVSARAFASARQIDGEKSVEYLRRLRMRSMVGGVDIEDEGLVFSVAEETGYDVEVFREIFDSVEPRELDGSELPGAELEIDSKTLDLGRLFDFEKIEDNVSLIGDGVVKKPPRELAEFVAKYGPVTAVEIAETYQIEADEAVKRLEAEDGVKGLEWGDGRFWVSYDHPM